MPDHLEDVVDRYLVSLQETDWESSTMDLRALWSALLCGSEVAPTTNSARQDPSREGLLAFIAAAHSLDGASGEQLSLRAGGWTVDATSGLIRTALSAALLTGLLTLGGVTGLSPIILPAVLPLLFDVRRARVSASHKELLAEVIVLPGVVGKVITAHGLYEQLPSGTQDEVSHLEVAAFLEELYDAGLADKDGDGYILRPPDKARFRISWR